MAIVLPTRDELVEAAGRYCVEGTWSAATIDALVQRLEALAADPPRWRGMVNAFVANPVGHGQAWREARGPEPRGAEALDVALLLLVVRTPGVLALPYTPAVYVGTWELVGRADGRPLETPAPRWRLDEGGGFAATGDASAATRWTCHRAGLDQLWLHTPTNTSRASKQTFHVVRASADTLELAPTREHGRCDRWRRIDGSD